MPGYISEIRYSGNSSSDFVEIVVPAGTNVTGYEIQLYDNGYIYDTFSIGTLQTTVGGYDIYVLDTTTDGGFYGITASDEVALVDGANNVLQFVSFGDSVTASDGDASGLTSQNIGTASGTDSLQSDDDGANYFVQTAPNKGTIPCYAPGTLIDTPDGPRAVEALKVGDLVETLDHGAMPILWLRSSEQALDGVGHDGKPVLIRAGALGPGRPARDLVVSPQHRILVGAAGQLDGVFGAQYFAPAKALTRLPYVRAMNGVKTITWIHFALDTHEVVTANGCLSESLLLGPMVLAGMSARQRREVQRLFRAPVEDALNGPPARDCLSVGETQPALLAWRSAGGVHAA